MIAHLEDGGNNGGQLMTMDIVRNCLLETITGPSSIADIVYPFHSAALSPLLDASTSSDPLNCPVSYRLYHQDAGTTWTLWDASVIKDVITFDPATLVLTVFYDVLNTFSPADHDNFYNLKLVGDLNNQGTHTVENTFNFNLKKDCSFASITAVNSALQSELYNVNN